MLKSMNIHFKISREANIVDPLKSMNIHFNISREANIADPDQTAPTGAV